MQAGPRHTSMALAVLLALLGFLTTLPPLQAQTASLVADLATERNFDGIALSRRIIPVQDKIFFIASEPTTGRELWVSDGTTHGTRVLFDFCPGPCDPIDFEILGTLGEALLFNVKNLLTDHVLWRSDGTREGTFALAETGRLELAANSVFLDGFLYFTSCEDETGCEIWRSDGTREGTGLVEDLEPGRGDSYPRSLTVAGGKLYFLTSDALHVLAPGAQTSTVIESLPPFSTSQLTAAGDRLFFLVTEEEEGVELWTSDGTASGTGRVTRFAPESPFISTFLTPAGPRILFIADDGERGTELWESDGTQAGTRPLTDFAPGSSVGLPRILGNRIVILAATQEKLGLWVVTRKPRSVTFLPPCPGCDTWSSIRNLYKIGERIVFEGEDDAHGSEPWTTDGTVAGTRLLVDICPGPCSSSFPDSLHIEPFPFPDVLVFAVGSSLWRTDGTPTGTVPLTGPDFFIPADRLAVGIKGRRVIFWGGKDSLWGLWEAEDFRQARLLAALPREVPESSNPVEVTALGDRAFFTTCGFPERIWQTAGSPETTSAIGEVLTGICPGVSFAAGGLLYLSSYNDLWRTDGTPDGMVQLAGEIDLTPELAELGGRVFFPARNGREIWRTDGTAAGTTPVIFLRQDAYDASALTAIGTQLYFMSQRPGGTALWRSDGTDAGTRKLADFSLDFDPSPDFTPLGPLVFFTAEDRIWGTNGTPEGTFLLHTPGGSISDLTAFQDSLYFFLDTADRQQLWRSNGTPQGTLLVREFAARDFHRRDPPRHLLTAVDGRLFFIADDGAHGVELWTSDGTAAGTAMVRDIHPGSASSDPRGLVEAAGRLFFTAQDAAHGRELWQSDGTAAGTRLVQDLAPEGLSSSPRELTVVGSRLFFSAYEPLTGRELWVLPLSGPACQPSSTRLCLNGGRFQVEAAWRDFEDNTGTGTAVPLSGDTGYFWFFDAANVEVVLKVLDGRGLNDHVWVFYGALSNVEYTLTVTDTQTGLTRRYLNPRNHLASVGDTHGFGPLGAYSTAADPIVALPSPPALVSARTEPASATGSCTPGPQRLCLNGGRFAVEASWKDFQGHTGAGTAVSLTTDTGYFWFFDAANVEVLLKVLDGTPLNGKFWVFYGALSNVEYTLTVTDTQTGAVRTYRNPSGRFASVADTNAF